MKNPFITTGYVSAEYFCDREKETADLSRELYQSVSIMHLESIDLQKYTEFAQNHFRQNNKAITTETIEKIYQKFDGITWYMQKMLHTLFTNTAENEICTEEKLPGTLQDIIDGFDYLYSEMLFRLPEKQKELLVAIAKEGNAKNITSGIFVRKYKLVSGSSVQAAVKGLLEKDFLTLEKGIYKIYDRFFEVWILEKY